jgi:hypothetical protein
MTTPFMEQEQSILKALPTEVQQTLREHPSVAEHFLRIRELPDLPKGQGCSVFEVYYDCEDSHSICIENGVIIPNEKPINQNPKIIEIMGPDDFVHIQVNGVPLRDRLNGNMPTVTGILVSV